MDPTSSTLSAAVSVRPISWAPSDCRGYESRELEGQDVGVLKIFFMLGAQGNM